MSDNRGPFWKVYAIRDLHVSCILRALRESAMSDVEGMKEACWENVDGGEDWKPIARGFLESILPRLNAHDILVDQKAKYERGAVRERTLAEKDGSKTIYEYMKTVIEELKKAARDPGRPELKVIK